MSKEPLCEVLQLELPDGVLPNEVTRYPNGSIQEIRCTFGMQMTLYGDETRGKLVEYRQHVRAGPVWILRPNMQPEDLYLPTDWERDSYGKWVKVTLQSAEHWIEDTKPVDPPPTTWRYGHRGDTRVVPAGEESTEAYDPWWSYRAIDKPHLSFPEAIQPPVGTRVVIKAEFQGSIIDLADGSIVVRSPVWSWRFDGD